jgi:cellulose synthase/poly-beta-1,6-N-acetylglucosamine synthase-like glycosyltransferase
VRGRQACFTLSALAGGWVLAGYPLSLQLLPSRSWRQDEALSPLVTIIVPAFRERESLRRKLEALRTLDYPADRLQVIVTIDEDRELADIARTAYPARWCPSPRSGTARPRRSTAASPRRRARS